MNWKIKAKDKKGLLESSGPNRSLKKLFYSQMCSGAVSIHEIWTVAGGRPICCCSSVYYMLLMVGENFM